MRNKILVNRLAFAALTAASLVAVPASLRADPVFDTPAKVITISASGDQDAITCSVYADVIIRISGTDTPAPDDAMLLQRPRPLAAFACAAKPSYGVTLQSEGFDLSGRKGNFLIFELSDPTGASGLLIFDARSGRKLFADGETAISVVEVAQGTLHVNYTRAINATCSLLADGNACWSQLLAGGEIPHGVFSGPPAPETCARTYRQAGAPAAPDDDPSIISYPVALTLDSAGHAVVQRLGPVGCDPMP